MESKYLSLLLTNRGKSNDLTKKVSMLLPKNNKQKTDARAGHKNDKSIAATPIPWLMAPQVWISSKYVNFPAVLLFPPSCFLLLIFFSIFRGKKIKKWVSAWENDGVGISTYSYVWVHWSGIGPRVSTVASTQVGHLK